MLKKIILAVSIILFLFISCSGQDKDNFFLSFNKLGEGTIKKVIIGFKKDPYGYEGIGVLKGNDIRFFLLDHVTNWVEDTRITFSLPQEFKDVFNYGPGIGIVLDDKIQFFDLHDSIWHENKDLMFMLPQNCQGVFNFFGGIGIIVENKTILYRHNKENNTWEEASDVNFELPKYTQSTFLSAYGEFLIIIDNKIKAYSDNNWFETKLNLPENYINALDIGWIGIATDKSIKFYAYFYQEGYIKEEVNENGWSEITNVEFIYSDFL